MSYRAWCLPCLCVALVGCPDDGDTRADLPDIAVETEVETDGSETTTPDADLPDDSAEPDTTAPDTTAPDTSDTGDTGAPEVVIGPGGCRVFTLAGDLTARDVAGVFQLGGRVDLGLGGPLPDAVIFEFASDETGTFDLTANGNDNFKTCTQCLRFVQDIDASGATKPKSFFQRAGTLTVDASTPPFGVDLDVILSGIEMEEVTIRASDFQSTPVEDGECYEMGLPITLETGTCKPSCGDHVCGSDGCGGSCGDDCEAGQKCQLDGTTCLSRPTCLPLAVPGPLLAIEPGVFRYDVTDLGLGAVDREDFVQFEFWAEDPGTFDLGKTPNTNYSTCKQCVRLIVDGRTELFQRDGTLVASPASTLIGDPDVDAFAVLELRGIVLEEVLIDSEFNSMAVEDGRCVELVDGPVSSPLPP